MRKYKLVIFDLDGTLLDSFPWFLSVVNDVAEAHGFRHVAPHEVEEMRGKGSRELVEFLDVPFWKIPAIARDMRRMKTERLKDIPLFAGVDRMLRHLSESGVVTAMVSSDHEENVRAALGDAQRIEQLTADLLLLARLEHDRLNPAAMTPVDLAALVTAQVADRDGGRLRWTVDTSGPAPAPGRPPLLARLIGIAPAKNDGDIAPLLPALKCAASHCDAQ